jgi:hypothetical protein
VSAEGAHDALYTETVPAQPRSQGVTFAGETEDMATLGYDSMGMADIALGYEALAEGDRTFVQLAPSVAPTPCT